MKINDRVVAPVTSEEGEVEFAVGTLIDINSRFAKVELDDGTVVRVGKSKVEPFNGPAPAKAAENEDEDAQRVIIRPADTTVGDETSNLLDGNDIETVRRVAAKILGISPGDLEARYQHLNPGHQRMCIGNRVRAALKKQESE